LALANWPMAAVAGLCFVALLVIRAGHGGIILYSLVSIAAQLNAVLYLGSRSVAFSPSIWTVSGTVTACLGGFDGRLLNARSRTASGESLST
jgi:hypothetical protein